MPETPLRPVLSLLLASACAEPLEGSRSDNIHEHSEIVLGPVQTCEDPIEGFDRLEQSAAERGIDHRVEAPEQALRCGAPPGGVVAVDLDADGDEDLLFDRLDGFPLLYENDGLGVFSLHELPHGTLGEDRPFYSTAVMDLDGDRLPEVYRSGDGFVVLARNRGGLDFSDWEVILDEPDWPRICHPSLAFGDIDTDGDLDLVVPALDVAQDADSLPVAPPDSPHGGEDRLLIQEDGQYIATLPLPRPAGPSLSLVQTFSDRDLDGDLDLFSWSDRAVPGGPIPPAATWRNEGLDEEGLPVLVDDAEAAGADTLASVMGVGSEDLNGDGRPDYCLSDVSPRLSCLLSEGDGYVEGAAALGLQAEVAAHPDAPPDLQEQDPGLMEAGFTTWGIAMIDIDNDGHTDVFTTAGAPPEGGVIEPEGTATRFQPDWAWKGLPDGSFEDAPLAHVEETLQHNYGLVSADLDQDGFRELVAGTLEGSPQVLDNPCGSGAWLEVELVGRPANPWGIGARVEVEADGRRLVQEVHGPVGGGQGPPALHFGLGDVDRVDEIEVHWANGARSVARDVEPRRYVALRHPDAGT